MNDLDKFRQEWLDEVASRTVAKGSDGSLLSKSQIQDPKDLTEIEALVEQTENTSISNLALDKKANDDNDENSDNSNEANGKRPPRSALSATVHAPPSSTLDKDSVFSFHAGAEVLEKDVSHYTARQQKAVEFFEQAVEREYAGQLGDAVLLYRNAYKVDETVDKLYREKWFSHYHTAAATSSAKDAISTKLEELEQNEKKKRLKREKDKKNKEKIDVSEMTAEEKKKMYAEMEEAIEEEAANEDAFLIEGALESFDELAILPLDEDLPSPFSKMPLEIITKIAMHLALNDLPSFRSMMNTCKLFHGVGMASLDIWRELAMREYPYQKYTPETWTKLVGEDEYSEEDSDDITREEMESVFASPGIALKTDISTDYKLQQEQKVLWNPAISWHGNWRSMYLLRPRIQFDGTYISTCNYLRPGRSDDSWYQPFIMVTYYRYLRFYKDGTCLSFLTTDEPRNIVPVFVKPSNSQKLSTRNRKDKNVYSVTRSDGTTIYRPKGISVGRWVHINTGGQILIKVEGSVENYTFFMRFDMKSSGRRRHNKLKWNEYWAIDPHGERLDFDLKNDKAFFFQKYRYDKR